jgi:hypothetical protein
VPVYLDNSWAPAFLSGTVPCNTRNAASHVVVCAHGSAGVVVDHGLSHCPITVHQVGLISYRTPISPIAPDAHRASLAHQIHLIRTSHPRAGLVPDRWQAPISGVAAHIPVVWQHVARLHVRRFHVPQVKRARQAKIVSGHKPSHSQLPHAWFHRSATIVGRQTSPAPAPRSASARYSAILAALGWSSRRRRASQRAVHQGTSVRRPFPASTSVLRVFLPSNLSLVVSQDPTAAPRGGG